MQNNELRYAGLIAACGMNCGLCIGYLREKKPCSGCYKIDDVNKPQGCRSCIIVNCELLAKTESGFCFECEKYPCARLKNLDKRYRTKYGMSMIENLACIKDHGLDEFIRLEQDKWKCKVCGAGLSVHRNFCLKCKTMINDILFERPVGTESNEKVCDLILRKAVKTGYKTTALPFDCKHWTKEFSFIEIEGNQYEIFPSPFSQPFDNAGELEVVSTLEELKTKNIAGKILLLNGDMTQQQLFPKDFPFYYPDEHKIIIDLLEEKQPQAIIAITGKDPMCGLNPFPLFEDGSFLIPSAFADKTTGEQIARRRGSVNLKIASGTESTVGRQIIASTNNNGTGKIIVCAHMDTKYGTTGALDNAAGIEVLLQIMANLKGYIGVYDIEFIPFNGEEYYGVSGQLEYLKYIEQEQPEIKLVINIDSPGHKASRTALSSYNFVESKQAWLNTKISENEYMEEGPQWYAGDHAMFAFRGIPCITVTSSNLFETVLDLTHTSNDTIENIDLEILKKTSAFLTKLINDYE